MFRIIARLWTEWQVLETQIEEIDREIGAIAKQDAVCRGLLDGPGVGPLVTTALVSAVANGAAFSNGRAFFCMARLGAEAAINRREAKLLGISKRGNPYLRRLFVHGARSVLMHCSRINSLGDRINQLELRTKRNIAAVALANKLARIAWAVLASTNEYRFTPVPVTG